MYIRIHTCIHTQPPQRDRSCSTTFCFTQSDFSDLHLVNLILINTLFLLILRKKRKKKKSFFMGFIFHSFIHTDGS